MAKSRLLDQRQKMQNITNVEYIYIEEYILRCTETIVWSGFEPTNFSYIGKIK